MKTKDKINSLIDISAKTVIGLLPNPASAVFNAVYDNIKENVLVKRIEEWKVEVIERIQKLEDEYDELTNNESFATALIKTSEIAVRTESCEKRKLLANALMNTYKDNIDEDKTSLFLQLVDKYSILHIQIIKYIHDEYMNEQFFNNNVPTFIVLFRHKFNKVSRTYLEKAISDLQNDYVIVKFKNNAQVTFMNRRYDLLTDLGNDFYDFLKS